MSGALEGIRVLDMTIWQQGTSASAMLADLGADVIKIEEASGGDPGRGLHVIERVGGLSAYFQALNRGKRSIALDLKQPEGRSVFFRLAEDADVFLTNYRPGVTERLGIGYKETAKANPAIIYARASGYGRDGPEAQEGSFDILGQARGGLMAITGDPDRTPKNAGAPIADQVGGMMAAFGILAALMHRERTGDGQEVDVSLLGSVMALQSFNITSYLFSGELPERFPRAGRTPFWNVYQGSDGKYFAIGMLLNRGWADVCDVIGRPELEEDERFTSYRLRVRDHADELIQILDEEFAKRPAAEWVKLLGTRGIFCAHVQDYAAIANDPQVLANDYIVEVPRPDGDPVRMVATPVQMSKSPLEIRSLAPEHGQHTEEILLEAGFSWDEIEALRSNGVIGTKHEPAQS
ncbi:MAG: CoA transferase [Chloroflexi bacterium]|nr:CoA transferase [Chloroflexota bacterium]